MNYIFVALGSALGGVARYAFSSFYAVRYPSQFPWGTLTVNILGCLLIGFLATIVSNPERIGIHPQVKFLLMAGFCGGFTTFSAFSLQTIELLRTGAIGLAALNVTVSVAGCLIATWLGFLIAK